MIDTCETCGAYAECTHHLIYGDMGALRKKADEDNLTLRLCNKCHNLGHNTSKIHGNIMAEKLSKMLGQAIWERNWIAENTSKEGLEEARREFMKRYGRSYL